MTQNYQHVNSTMIEDWY